MLLSLGCLKQQLPIIIEQILVQTFSNYHLVIIGRLESLSFVIVQYVIDRSLIVIIIMLEMNARLTETTILILYHCFNNIEKQHYQRGLIF